MIGAIIRLYRSLRGKCARCGVYPPYHRGRYCSGCVGEIESRWGRTALRRWG